MSLDQIPVSDPEDGPITPCPPITGVNPLSRLSSVMNQKPDEGCRHAAGMLSSLHG
jgi:hypothetical protein